ncbi:MAG: pyridoxamine 5'-phosphate oxidase [Candidatus Sumerlaeaceae bacterium]
MAETTKAGCITGINPIEKFRELFEKAAKNEAYDHTACCLATVDHQGRPTNRMVLLKGFDERGFVFYTNRLSPKGQHLAKNPYAALCFYWPSIGDQVRIEGHVEQTSDEESDAYFATRPRGSQLGAWASHQSQPLPSRVELISRYMQYKVRFMGRSVPRPPFWGGYRINPERIEFWHNGLFRLHDRFLYTRCDDGWSVVRLSP